MCANFRNGAVSKLVGYTYPVLHTGTKWYVDFYAIDPAKKSMRRKKYYIKDNLKSSEKKRRAAEIIETVSKQLMQGWNPWVSNDETRGFVLFEDCLNKYEDYIDRMERFKTRTSYRSRVNILRKYINGLVNPILYVYQFDLAFCNDFLDFIYLDRENSARTRNNYRGWLYSFAEFLISRKYIAANPVDKIKAMPERDGKIRKDLTPEMMRKLQKHLMEVDKFFYLACMFQYYTLIRPGELSHLKIGDISVSKCTVFVSKEFSKNWRDAEVGLNKSIIKLMIDLDVLTKPSNYYLFGRHFKPNEERADADQFNKRWQKVRKVLGWSECYQFYSLKDTGIRDLANAAGVVVARDQARHSDVSTTNRYIQKHDVQKSTLNFDGGFSYGEDEEDD